MPKFIVRKSHVSVITEEYIVEADTPVSALAITESIEPTGVGFDDDPDSLEVEVSIIPEGDDE